MALSSLKLSSPGPLPAETVARIDAARIEHSGLRARDLARHLDLPEAVLLAADVGRGVRRIAASPSRLMPRLEALGDVMALTRNESAVHERRGVYRGWHAGTHAAMVLGGEIDLRIFPAHWVHGFAVETDGPQGVARSLQVFDAAGDAIHKVHLKPESDVAAFESLVADLSVPADAPFALADRKPVEPARADPALLATLRADWEKMTDTHQFLMMVKKLKMNRLGANRLIGAPWAEPLTLDAVSLALEAAAADAVKFMVFVGNPGCIQIHSGTVTTVKPMGPWQNVLDPRFNLHLRTDHIAEVWRVTKPTERGPAISVEAFDAQGALILQLFGKRAEAETDTSAWDRLVAGLPLAADRAEA